MCCSLNWHPMFSNIAFTQNVLSSNTSNLNHFLSMSNVFKELIRVLFCFHASQQKLESISSRVITNTDLKKKIWKENPKMTFSKFSMTKEENLIDSMRNKIQSTIRF